jgi:hypothetical protein
MIKTYTCQDCLKEEVWRKEDARDGSYPEFGECEYCEVFLCADCMEDHLDTIHREFEG